MEERIMDFSKESSHLNLVGVSKRFKSLDGDGKQITAVDDIDLEIQEGELTTLLGPSGCGKTTTLRMVAGFESVTEGEITLGDDSIVDVPPNKRNMAMMFQSYALFPHMTVYDNIAYGLKLKKLPKDEIRQRVEKVMELMQISNMRNRFPAQVSGGQQQRVALARAVVIEPKVLLFDEPLSNLDAKLREYMREELRSLQRRLGITSLYVTHDQAEAMAISDKVVLMKDGKIAQVGSPEELYGYPNSKFVADFIGKSNFAPCKVVSKSADSAQVDVYGKQLVLPEPGGQSKELAVSDEAVIVVRPEAIEVLDPGKGTFNGKVKNAVYFGTHIEYLIQVGDDEYVVEQYKPQVQKVYKTGDDVSLEFLLPCVRLLKDEAI